MDAAANKEWGKSFAVLLLRAIPQADTLEEAIEAVDAAMAMTNGAAQPIKPPSDAAFSFDIFSRRAQGVLNKTVAGMNDLSTSARRELKAALALTEPGAMYRAIIQFVQHYRTQLGELLGATNLSALLAGAREVADKLPPVPLPGLGQPPPPSLPPDAAAGLLSRLEAMPDRERAETVYQLPPEQQEWVQRALAIGTGPPMPPFTPPSPPAESPAAVHFPTIEEAVKDLSARNVVSRDQYDRLDAAARQKAFTVARVESDETLAKIRGALAEVVAEGADVEAFRAKVLERVEPDTFLSPAHLDVVARSNIQAAFSDGQMAVLNTPFVRSGFPYASVHPIHDDRARHDHLEVEKIGIQGTNVFRVDDPVFQTFRAPWDFNCRCGWTPMSVKFAAEKGIAEAQKWLETNQEPSPPAFVPFPSFRPPPEFQRALAGAPLSIRLSMLPMDLDAAFGQWKRGSQVGSTQSGEPIHRWYDSETGQSRDQSIEPGTRQAAAPQAPAPTSSTPQPPTPPSKPIPPKAPDAPAPAAPPGWNTSEGGEASPQELPSGPSTPEQHAAAVARESQNEYNRLNVLGEAGAVPFFEPKAAMTDEQLLEASSRKALPMPGVEAGSRLESQVGKAWGAVSRLWPEMAGKLAKVREFTPEEMKQQRFHPTAALDLRNKELVVPAGGRELEPEVLWHELVHLDQVERGDFFRASHKNPDGTLTDHGRLMESEAHQRGNMQADALIKRLNQKQAPAPIPESSGLSDWTTLSLHDLDAAFGMVGDEWHGPTAPGPGWVQVGQGERGGLIWKQQGGQSPQPSEKAKGHGYSAAEIAGMSHGQRRALANSLGIPSKGMTEQQLQAVLSPEAPKPPAPVAPTVASLSPQEHQNAVRALIAAKALGVKGVADPRGDLKHLPPEPERAKIESAMTAIADAHEQTKKVPISADKLYAALEQQGMKLRPEVFRASLLNIHNAGKYGLGGWSRMLEDMPRPDLAAVILDRPMYHLHGSAYATGGAVLSVADLDAAFGMDAQGNWHGPTAPGPGWVEVGQGPRGGKVWKQQAGSAPLQTPAPKMDAKTKARLQNSYSRHGIGEETFDQYIERVKREGLADATHAEAENALVRGQPIHPLALKKYPDIAAKLQSAQKAEAGQAPPAPTKQAQTAAAPPARVVPGYDPRGPKHDLRGVADAIRQAMNAHRPPEEVAAMAESVVQRLPGLSELELRVVRNHVLGMAQYNLNPNEGVYPPREQMIRDIAEQMEMYVVGHKAVMGNPNAAFGMVGDGPSEFAFGSEPPAPGWEYAGEMKWVRRTISPKPPAPQEGSPRIAVVGGGPGGLFAAYILNQKLPEAAVTIFEASDRLGGKIQTAHFADGTPYEAGVAELYEYLGPKPDPLRQLIEDDLGLPTVNMQGGAVHVRGKLVRDMEDVHREFGYATRKRISAFHRKVADLMPLDKYAQRWQPDNEHPWAGKTFAECIREELADDPEARAYIETAVHSDLATEPWTCNGLNGIKNVLMDNEEYMQLYHVVGGLFRVPETVAQKIRADVRLQACVRRVEKDGDDYKVAFQDGSSEAFDAVILCLPNHWLNQLCWPDGPLKDAIQRMLAHYDLPAHYLRVSFNFRSRWWDRLKIEGDYWMMDAFHGCCVYDESARWESKIGHVLSFLLAGQDALNLVSANQSDGDIANCVLAALPDEWRADAQDNLIESRVERYIGSVNACPGGWPAEELIGEHQPEPVGHPGLFICGDFLFDSTLNAALISAGTAVDLLLKQFGKRAAKGTPAVEQAKPKDGEV